MRGTAHTVSNLAYPLIRQECKRPSRRFSYKETDPHVEVFPFPTKAIENLKRVAFGRLEDVSPETLRSNRRSALPHQVSAIDGWERQGKRGIFEHATGSGKTFGPQSLQFRGRRLSKACPSLVLVPSRLLLDQWAGELRDEVPSAALLLAGAGNDRWRVPNRLKGMTDSDTSLGGRIVLATMQTASMSEFMSNVRAGRHLLIVADEVHQVGSTQNSRIMDIDAGSRLGLSATPIRYGDPDGDHEDFCILRPHRSAVDFAN